MKVSKIMFAVAALAAGNAMALTPDANIGYSSGASASKGNLKLALANRCAGQLGEFTDTTTNVSTYVCAPAASFALPDRPTAAEYAAAGTTNFTGTTIGELRLNVNGGSFTAVCLLTNSWGVGACPAVDLYKDPATNTGPIGTPETTTLSAAPATATAVGGLMDVEPNAFLASVRLGIPSPAANQIISARFNQSFGVAVSDFLYQAMFTDQQAAGKLPASCFATDTAKPECVPVIGKSQMATIMSVNSTNAAYNLGAQFLVPSLAAAAPLHYARRVDTSGTQAGAQEYFLGNVCNTTGQVGVVAQGAAAGTPVGANMIVYGLPTTGGARGVLNTAGQYSIAVLSAENGQAQNWKWVRVGGMNVAENAVPNLSGANTATSIDGRYDYWFTSRIVRPNAAPSTTFWTSVTTGFAAVPVGNTKGLFAITETNYTKGTATSCALPVSN
jgi:hypothetical protein